MRQFSLRTLPIALAVTGVVAAIVANRYHTRRKAQSIIESHSVIVDQADDDAWTTGPLSYWVPKEFGTRLDRINIRREPLRGELLWAVSQVQEVQEVIVADSNVGVDECIALAGMDNLHTISLHGSTIERGSVAALCRSRSLQNLGLAITNTTDGDCQHIASCRSITTLNLSGTMITDAGLSWIARLPRLSHLAVSPDAITPTGLAGVVARHPTLVVQCFGPSKYEERRWKEIEQRFPRCAIHR